MRDLELPELFTWEIKLDKHDRYYIEMATAHFGSLEILLDVSTIRRNRPQMTHLLDIQTNHPELPIGYPVRCHTDLQVLASKYNCLSSRYKGRDLYDFRYLAEESDNIAKDAWDVYLQTFKKYQTKNNPFLLLKRIKDELVDFEKAWNSDVADSFIDKNESFDETICAIETILRDTIKLPQ